VARRRFRYFVLAGSWNTRAADCGDRENPGLRDRSARKCELKGFGRADHEQDYDHVYEVTDVYGLIVLILVIVSFALFSRSGTRGGGEVGNEKENEEREDLFGAQGDHRVDAGGAMRGDPASEQGDRKQEDHDGGEDPRIEWAYPEELAADEPGDGERTTEA
jgi:hypothetical protein